MAKEDWNNVDVTALAPRTRELYQAAKDCYLVYKQAKEEFETTMQRDFAEHIPDGRELKFGYMFGKLSIAVGPKSERKAAASKPKQGLAEWLAEQGERAS